MLRTRAGRLRLGWRLAVFLFITFAVITIVALLLPPHILVVPVGTLVGSVLAGWLLLAGDGRGPSALGFHLPRAAPEALKGLGLGTALGLAVVLAMAAVGGLRWTTDDGSALGWLSGGVSALAFLTIPAAAEEALMRGYPFQALAESWGSVAALLLTSVMFGALHLANPGVTWLGVVNVAAAGLFLGVVYVRTGSLWWATGAHLGWNWALGFVADVPVSGLELMDAPFYEGVPRGPEWLGGGVFGPEGSAVATVCVLAATVWCWFTPRLRPSVGAVAADPLVWAGRGAQRAAAWLEGPETREGGATA